MRTHGQQFLLGLLVVRSILAVGVQAQVVEHGGNHLVRRVQKGDATTGKLLRIFRLEQHRPGIDLVDAKRGLDLFDVIADAVGAPQIGRRMGIAGIVLLQLLEQ